MKKNSKIIIPIILFLFLQTLNPSNKSILLDESFINEYKGTIVKNKIEEKLEQEVDKFIKYYAPDTKLSPEYLVAKCLEYNIDISFVLAQGLLESHFGTKGKSKYTNSIWNVGTYDNGEILYKYKHPNQSIIPYLKLIKNKYLKQITNNGDTIPKSIKTLLNSGYININGLRFASEKSYEKRMKILINKINYTTKIKIYQDYLKQNNKQLAINFNKINFNEI